MLVYIQIYEKFKPLLKLHSAYNSRSFLKPETK